MVDKGKVNYRTDEEIYEIEERRKKQISIMKVRLHNLYEESHYHSIRSLYNDLLAYEYSLYFAENSLSQTLNIKNPNYETTFNYNAAITLCRFFNKDISSLFAPPENGQNNLTDADPLQSGGKYRILDDEKYQGDFYGYMFSRYYRNENEDEIIPISVSIYPRGNQFEATLRYKHPKKTHELVGIPKLITATNTVYIIFTNQQGDFFEMFFHYKKYTRDKMWYRKGLIVTNESSTENPIALNFILLDKEVPNEKLKYLPGMLKFCESHFCISEEKLKELMDTNSDINAFVSEYHYLLEHNKKQMYVFNENTLMSLIKEKHSDERYFDICQLMLIKENAEIPSMIQYPKSNEYPEFSHDYLIQ